MTTLHWILIAGLALAILVILKAIFTRHDLTKTTCSVRQSFCSRERRKFWQALQQAVGDDYVVLANAPLAAVIAADGNDGGPLQEWMQQRWIDFVILHEELFMPAAIVQFERGDGDDPLWEPGRDHTLVKVLEQAGLTLLWLPSDHYQHIDLLRHALEQAKAQGQVAAGLFNTEKGSEGNGRSTLDF